ncbi:MAG: putative quinol monooxygenase [Rhizobiaceae bacterium]
MFAVVVRFKIKDGTMDRFMPLMLANAQASLREEEGCHQFDVCTDGSRPGEVFLYELYSDEAAFEVHKSMPHFMQFDIASADLIASKQVVTYRQVAQ